MNQKKSIITDSGFIQLHRKLLEWEWYTDTNTKALFIHILLKANHADKQWRGVNIKRGSFITSVSKLSLETGLSIKNVRTALKHLEETNEVARSTSSINTTITVLNYDNYQTGGKVGASELANKGQGRGKVGATTNNYNNENNDNKLSKEDFSLIFRTYKPNYRVLPDMDTLEYKRCDKVVKELGSVEEVIKVIKEYFQYLATEDWRKPKGFKEFMNSSEHYGNDWLSEIKGSNQKQSGNIPRLY